MKGDGVAGNIVAQFGERAEIVGTAIELRRRGGGNANLANGWDVAGNAQRGATPRICMAGQDKRCRAEYEQSAFTEDSHDALPFGNTRTPNQLKSPLIRVVNFFRSSTYRLHFEKNADTIGVDTGRGSNPLTALFNDRFNAFSCVLPE